MIAAAAGDARYAMRATRDAEKLIGEDPLTLLLRAQTAQLEGDRQVAETTFSRMVERPETRAARPARIARRSGAARRRPRRASLCAAGASHHAARLGGRSAARLACPARRMARRARHRRDNRSQKAITREQADRQRAVLLTAKAREETDAIPKPRCATPAPP